MSISNNTTKLQSLMDKINTLPEAGAGIEAHNTDTTAHADIRNLISGLTTRLNTLANSTDEDLDQMAEIVTYIKSNKSLIDGITTSKVNVSDIIDNLTTNVANKPLSAAQGVALKALIDAITVPTKVSELTNDSGYITSYTETDPTVPAWAKTATKPTYTAEEVGAAKEGIVYIGDTEPTDENTEIWINTAEDWNDNIQNNVVLYEAQALTNAQKEQARTNIGAASVEDITQLNNEKVGKNELTLGVQDGKIFLFVGGVAVGNGVEQSTGVSGDVVGYIDADNNIVLTGTVPEGATYSVKYEMEDGSTVDIGELSLEEAVEIINQIPISIGTDGKVFNNCGYKTSYRISSSGTESAIANYSITGYIPAKQGDTIYVDFLATTDTSGNTSISFYSSDFTFLSRMTTVGNWTDEGNGIHSFTVAQTNTAYVRVSNNTLFDGSEVATVNQMIEEGGTIVTPTPDTPTALINQIPLSTDASGNLFVGTNGEKGYKTGYRLSNSSGNESVQANYEVTGFIPATYDDTVYGKNFTLEDNGYANIVFYDADKKYIFGTFTASAFTTEDGVHSITIKQGVYSGLEGKTPRYIRISAIDITDETIITVNQSIE